MLIKELNEALARELSKSEPEDEITGFSTSVKCSSNYSWSKVFGNTSPDDDKKIGFNSRYPIYSITKTFTATAILKLVSKGEISLDSKLSDYLDTNISGTIRELLNHTSGLPCYGPLEQYHLDVKKNPSTPWSQSDFEKIVQTEPGVNSWSYSNIGYMYLRLLLEKLTSSTFKQAIDNLVISPLNLVNTEVLETIDDLNKLVKGNSQYLSTTKTNEKLIDVRQLYHPGWCAPGLIASTSHDICASTGAIFDTDFLPMKLKEEMVKPVDTGQSHPLFKTAAYGLGLMIDPDNELGVILGHGGSGPGYSAAWLARYNPDPQKPTECAVVLSNSENPEFCEKLAYSLLIQVNEKV